MKAAVSGAWTGWRAPVAAMLVMLALALPGFFTLPPVDRDEARFARASAQMIETGDLIDIRLGDEPRYKKPVGIYWLQAAVAGLTAPDRIWAYRLVSIAGAMAAVGLTVLVARRAMGGGAALMAGVIMASSFLLGGEARLAKTDAVQLACILAAQLVLARAFLPGGRAQQPVLSPVAAMGFWAAVGAGILVKGPIAPLVAFSTLTVICLYRRDLAILRALRPLPGVLLMLGIVAPWLIAITVKSGGAFWQASVGEDLLAKVGEGQENHGAPPGSYLLAVWGILWPGAALLAAALPGIWRMRRAPLAVFALGWAVPVWLLFELTATKLIHYTLPAYPALAILTAGALAATPPGGLARAVGSLLAVAVPVLVLVAMWLGARDLGAVPGWTYFAGAALLVPGVALLIAGLWRNHLAAMTGGLAASGLALSVALFPTLARMPVLWPSVALSQVAAAHPGCRFVTLGYGEPSLLFLTQGAVRFTDAAGLGAALAEPGCVLLAVESREVVDSAGWQPAGSVRGVNLGNGRSLDFALYLRP